MIGRAYKWHLPLTSKVVHSFGLWGYVMAGLKELIQWERAEIERSEHEAGRTDPSVLKVSEKVIARYSNPPADTCFALEYAYHLAGDVRGKVVLDLGCGTGENALMLAKCGAKVLAMDISESLIRLAMRRLDVHGASGDARFLVGSAHQIPLPDEAVDLVFGIAILHHLDLSLAAREIRRVLREGGRAVFKEPVRNSAALRVLQKLIPNRDPEISPFERPLTDNELKQFASGFSRFQSKAFILPHVRAGERLSLRSGCLRELHHLDGKILRRFPSLDYFADTRVIELVR